MQDRHYLCNMLLYILDEATKRAENIKAALIVQLEKTSKQLRRMFFGTKDKRLIN